MASLAGSCSAPDTMQYLLQTGVNAETALTNASSVRGS